MKLHIPIILFILFLSSAYGQNKTISGKIIDSATKQVVPFANIIVKNTTIGTVSNELGEFSLPINLLPQVLITSHLAYQTQEITITKLDVIEINLLPIAMQLPEFTVADTYARDLLKSAHKTTMSKRSNFSFAKCFYRQITETDQKGTEIQETISDVCINNSRIIGYNLQQGRYGVAKTQAFSLGFFSFYTKTHGLFPDDSLKFNTAFIHIAPPDTTKKEMLSIIALKKYIYQPEGVLAEISLTHKIYNYNILFYIDTTKLEIRKVILKSEGVAAPKLNINSKKHSIQNPIFNCELNFDYYQNILSISSIKVSQSFAVHKDGELQNKMNVKSFALFYDKSLKNNGVVFKSTTTGSDRKDIKKLPYNAQFWRDNPIIKLTPLETTIIADFEKSETFGTYFEE